jgi:hypothetical protein
VKIWCVACFYEVQRDAHWRLELSNIYLFSSAELACKFVKSNYYQKMGYEEYEIYDSELDFAV